MLIVWKPDQRPAAARPGGVVPRPPEDPWRRPLHYGRQVKPLRIPRPPLAALVMVVWLGTWVTSIVGPWDVPPELLMVLASLLGVAAFSEERKRP